MKNMVLCPQADIILDLNTYTTTAHSACGIMSSDGHNTDLNAYTTTAHSACGICPQTDIIRI